MPRRTRKTVNKGKFAHDTSMEDHDDTKLNDQPAKKKKKSDSRRKRSVSREPLITPPADNNEIGSNAADSVCQGEGESDRNTASGGASRSRGLRAQAAVTKTQFEEDDNLVQFELEQHQHEEFPSEGEDSDSDEEMMSQGQGGKDISPFEHRFGVGRATSKINSSRNLSSFVSQNCSAKGRLLSKYKGGQAVSTAMKIYKVTNCKSTDQSVDQQEVSDGSDDDSEVVLSPNYPGWRPNKEVEVGTPGQQQEDGG